MARRGHITGHITLMKQLASSQTFPCESPLERERFSLPVQAEEVVRISRPQQRGVFTLA